MGYPVDKSYEDSSDVVHAGKLSGVLMLIVGDLDTNVDPSTTLQFVNALNKADKDYELLFIPEAGHGAGKSSYAVRRQMDFWPLATASSARSFFMKSRYEASKLVSSTIWIWN